MRSLCFVVTRDFPVTVTPLNGGNCHRNNAMISTCSSVKWLTRVALVLGLPLVFWSLLDSSQTQALHHKSLWCAVGSFGTIPQILTSFSLSVRSTKAGVSFFPQFLYKMRKMVGLTNLLSTNGEAKNKKLYFAFMPQRESFCHRVQHSMLLLAFCLLMNKDQSAHNSPQWKLRQAQVLNKHRGKDHLTPFSGVHNKY